MAVLFDTGIFSVVGLDSALLVGAKLYWYATGTSTPLATYSDNALSVPNTNPVVAGADGRFGPIYLQSAQYKYILKSAAGITLVTRDPISGVSALDSLSGSGGAADVGFIEAGAGAVATDAQAQLRRGFMFPENFSTLQQAITAAANAKVCLWLSSTYTVSASLTCPDNTWIGGPGCIKAANGALISTAILRATGADNIRIENIEVDGNGDNTGADYGIWITGGSGHRIDGCYVHDTAQTGISYQGLSDSFIDGNRVIDCGRANRVSGAAGTDNHGIMIYTDSASDLEGVKVRENIVVNAYRKGITTYTGSTGTLKNVTISDNDVRDCLLGGIYCASAPGAAKQQGVTIADNTIDACYVNLTVASLIASSISGNESTNATLYGYNVADNCDHLSIVGNSDAGSGQHGWLITTTSGVNSALTFVGNTVSNPNTTTAATGAGVYIYNTTYSTISGNTIVDTSAKMTHGILEGGTADYNVIVGNNVPTATSAPYLIVGTHTALHTTKAAYSGFGGVDSPTATIDMNGGFRERPTALALTNGTNQNINITAGTYYVTGPSANYSIGGIVAGNNGDVISIANYTAYTMTNKYNDAGSSAGNKILALGGADSVTPQYGVQRYRYFTAASAWLMEN